MSVADGARQGGRGAEEEADGRWRRGRRGHTIPTLRPGGRSAALGSRRLGIPLVFSIFVWTGSLEGGEEGARQTGKVSAFLDGWIGREEDEGPEIGRAHV